MATMRVCIVCGKKYEYCPHCNKNNKSDRWKSSYCSQECRGIFYACGDYESGSITQEEAYNRLIGLGIESISAKKAVKNSVDKIMSFNKTVVEPEAKIVEQEAIVDQEPIVEESVIEEISGVVEQTVQKRSRRHRSYKKFDEE